MQKASSGKDSKEYYGHQSQRLYLSKTYTPTPKPVKSSQNMIWFSNSDFYYDELHLISVGFPSGSAVKNLSAMREPQEMQVRSLGQEDPLEEGVGTHSVFLPGESPGERSLMGYSP